MTKNLILTLNWIDANGPFQFFPHLFLITSCVSYCPIASDRTIPQENSINAERSFLKAQGITTFFGKRTIVNFEEPVARIKFVLLRYFSEHSPLVIETIAWCVRALDKTALEVLGSAGTVHF